MNIEIWEKSIDEYIPTLLESEPDAKNAQLLASLFALKKHFERMNKESSMSSQKIAGIEAEDNDSDKQWLLDTISEELSDSDMYYSKYLETKNDDYKKISKDELHHSEILLKILRKKYSDTDIQELMMWHNSILARLA